MPERPLHRLSQSASTSAAPAKRPAMPTTAIADLSSCIGEALVLAAALQLLALPLDAALDRVEAGSGRPRAAQESGQLRDRRVLEQVEDAQLGLEQFLEPAVRLDDQQRIAAEREEIVLDADALALEQLGPE